MIVDQTTLADLEIFESGGGGSGLFELIARTSTSLGRSALRRRITNPSSEIAEIRETQQAVQFLAVHPGLVRFNDSMVSAVQRYLRSNISVSDYPSWWQRFEPVWWKVRYPDVFEEVQQGVNDTTALFDHLSVLCSALRARKAPSLIANLVASIEAVATVVLETRSKALTVLELDRMQRASLHDQIEGALLSLGELDALNAMARVTSEHGWSWPELIESDTFIFEADGLYHPFVNHAVRNPVRLTGGEPMVFLTGPNMAGKTTYLRSVALTALLAQVGMGVPASRARLSPVQALFTSLNPRDNLRAGLSFFLAEVLRVKAAAEILASGKRALVLFDEVFKGTNVRDALDASAEVILGFAKAHRSGFIFSSHLIELVEILQANPAIRFFCFEGDIEEGLPRYTFQLREGVSDKRFGLFLLRQARVPELIAQISA